MNIEESIRASLKNISKYGDTDIFPFLIEKNILFDKEEKCKELLLKIHNEFDTYISQNPPSIINSLTQVGYTGFRWASQIEPFWNAYYLALVLNIAEKIETQRLSFESNKVFSYRFEINESNHKLFKDSTWNTYKISCIEKSQDYKYIIESDISDFYPRIYHHRIENALNRLPNSRDITKKIMRLLSHFSNNVSYGLPIGGPASRILAELALDSVDKLMVAGGIEFCRYADDYTIFCESKSEAYKILIKLSEFLFNEGLNLQKKKTKIISLEEYTNNTQLLVNRLTEQEMDNLTPEEKLLNISIHFDPYSETAVEDYEKLKEAVKGVDIIGILGRELNKTVIDTSVTKQAINAIRALDSSEKGGAILTILSEKNVEVLAPVFITIMRTLKGIYDELSDDIKDSIDSLLVNLYESDSHLLSVELNLSYFIQVLSKRHSSRKEQILIQIFNSAYNSIIKREIILIMANWNIYYWVSSLKQKYGGFSEWEKRAFIIASYFLKDEGKHWRNHTKHFWSDRDALVKEWFSERFQVQKNIPI